MAAELSGMAINPVFTRGEEEKWTKKEWKRRGGFWSNSTCQQCCIYLRKNSHKASVYKGLRTTKSERKEIEEEAAAAAGVYGN